jgi:citrate lyase subunit beta/citryl-CoA lyase
MSRTVETGRSLLFVPASRPDRIPKALGSQADYVIIDLEDAVAPAEKDEARRLLLEALEALEPSQLPRMLVRVNAAATRWHEEDLKSLAPLCGRGLGAVMIPKSESVAALESAASTLGPAARLVPLIESLAGMDVLNLIAHAKQIVRVAFGNLDFQLDLGMRCLADEPELASVRFEFVAASRRARLAAPIDGVTAEIPDGQCVQRDAQRSRAFGFGGKLCIHPAQAARINQAFCPSDDELEWARRVMAAAASSTGAVVSVDGKMVDLPVIRLAEKTLQLAVGVL